MGIKDHATNAAKSAVSIAVATSSLSTCTDNGAVDPAPPPLQCDEVGEGQTLQAEAAVIDSDTVSVTVQHIGFWGWAVDSVSMVSGGALSDVALPDPNTGYGPLLLRITFDAGEESVVFAVYVKNFDDRLTCDIVRQFTVTRGGVISSLVHPLADDLPLPVRLPVSIKLLEHDGNTAQLEASSPYSGEMKVSWEVSDGTLAVRNGERVTWELPEERGIYQVEVTADFGIDGLAFDTLPLEVS